MFHQNLHLMSNNLTMDEQRRALSEWLQKVLESQ